MCFFLCLQLGQAVYKRLDANLKKGQRQLKKLQDSYSELQHHPSLNNLPLVITEYDIREQNSTMWASLTDNWGPQGRDLDISASLHKKDRAKEEQCHLVTEMTRHVNSLMTSLRRLDGEIMNMDIEDCKRPTFIKKAALIECELVSASEAYAPYIGNIHFALNYSAGLGLVSTPKQTLECSENPEEIPPSDEEEEC